jgi:hypothetical protein
MDSYSASISVSGVLPHPAMLPNGPSVASPGCSRGRVTLSIGAQSDWASVASRLGSWSRFGDAGERPGASWAPGRIAGRGHRRPRLYRPVNLSCHHWALNIPGVWGRSPQAFARFEVNLALTAADRWACGPTSRRSRRRGAQRRLWRAPDLPHGKHHGKLRASRRIRPLAFH